MNALFRLGKFGLLACVVAVAGCQPMEEKPTMGLVTGTVTSGGKPVAEGMIGFENPQEGTGGSATIVDGKFSFDGPVSIGSYKVTILPPKIEPPLPGAPSPESKTYNDIPAKYRSSTSSDLKAEVHEGENQLQFELKP